MVKNILLIRHAEAQQQTEAMRDFDRGLTTNGTNQATILGTHLDQLPVYLDAIYISPSLRTLMTSKLVVEQMNYTPRLMDAEELYEATENLMKAFLSRIDPMFNNVAIIAHNPAIAQIYAYLTMRVRDFYPATSAWLELAIDDWKLLSSNMASEKDYYYPGMV